MTITKADHLATILKHSLAGKTPAQIAAITGHPEDDVLDELRAHEWPHEARMRAALDALTAQGATTPTRKPGPPEVRNPVNKPDPQKMSGADLIAAGNKSKSPTVARATKRAEKALDAWKTAAKALQDALLADREDAVLREQINKLEAELAAARSKLRGETTTPKKPAARAKVLPDGMTYKQVRAWAALNDVDCPITGRVPNRVIDEFLAAHSSTGRVEALYEQAWPTPGPGQEG